MTNDYSAGAPVEQSTAIDLPKINNLLKMPVGPSDSVDEVNAIAGCCVVLDRLQPDQLRRVFQYLGSRYLDSMKTQWAQLDSQIPALREAIAGQQTAELHKRIYPEMYRDKP